jgi:hypothetical protein
MHRRKTTFNLQLAADCGISRVGADTCTSFTATFVPPFNVRAHNFSTIRSAKASKKSSSNTSANRLSPGLRAAALRTLFGRTAVDRTSCRHFRWELERPADANHLLQPLQLVRRKRLRQRADLDDDAKIDSGRRQALFDSLQSLMQRGLHRHFPSPARRALVGTPLCPPREARSRTVHCKRRPTATIHFFEHLRAIRLTNYVLLLQYLLP